VAVNDPKHACPLCGSADTRWLCRDRWRDYFRCTVCELISVPAAQFVSAAEEKARYDQHRNSPDDPGYRAFLSRLLNPMLERLRPGSHGLDFGSGPGPTLSLMFIEAGHTMAIYDPFYAPDASVLERQYDFVTASEVVEHLRRPRQDLDRMWACVKPGGILGLMTSLVPAPEAFRPDWRYARDLTHVCFYSSATCAWLAAQWRADFEIHGADAALLQKRASPNAPQGTT
jgi:SAM-dependent methyltransferase